MTHLTPRSRPDESARFDPQIAPGDVPGAPGALADLAAYPLTHLGYVPWDSLCLIGTRTSGHRGLVLGPVARLDLAALEAPEAERWIGDIAATLLGTAAMTSICVVLVGAPVPRARPFPQAVAAARETLRLVQRAVAPAHVGPVVNGGARLDARGCLVIEGESWGHVWCDGPGGPDSEIPSPGRRVGSDVLVGLSDAVRGRPAGAGPRCCPDTGRDLAQVRASRVWADHVLAGRTVCPTRADLGVGRCGVPGCLAEVARVLTDVREGSAGGHRNPEDAAIRWRDAVLARVEHRDRVPDPGGSADAGRGCHPALVGALSAGIRDRRVRDALIAWAVSAPGTTDIVTLLEPRAINAAFAAAGPPGERTAATIRCLEEVASHAPGAAGAPALAALGYLLWWSGQGARADVVTRQALAIDPDHSLADLVRQVLEGCLAPPWVGGGADAAR